MNSKRVIYAEISVESDRRYNTTLPDRGKALIGLASQHHTQRILEVGCGTGYWLEALRSVAPDLYGLDFSTGMLTQAQQRNVCLHFTVGTATQLPFDHDQVDLVYCVDAIHHFGEARSFIAEAFRVLKPGGVRT